MSNIFSNTAFYGIIGIMTELIDQLDGDVPDGFTDADWVRLATEHRVAGKQIDFLSPDHSRYEEKYRIGLGTTPTNNLWLWFITKPESDANDDSTQGTYDLDATVHDETPGVQELKVVRNIYPDLFIQVQVLCDQHNFRYRSFLDTLNSKQAPSEEDFIMSTISLFKMHVGIEKVLNVMRGMGVSEEAIGILGR